MKYFKWTVCIHTLLLILQFVTIGYTQHGRSFSHQVVKCIAEVTLWSSSKASIGIMLFRVEQIHEQRRNGLSIWSLPQRKVFAAKVLNFLFSDFRCKLWNLNYLFQIIILDYKYWECRSSGLRHHVAHKKAERLGLTSATDRINILAYQQEFCGVTV